MVITDYDTIKYGNLHTMFVDRSNFKSYDNVNVCFHFSLKSLTITFSIV